MGASSERIALSITSSADVTAVQKARAEVSATGQAAKAANEAVAASAVATAQAQQAQAVASSSAAKASGALTVSQGQMSEALKRNGGDLAKAAAELAKLTGAEKAAGAEDEKRLRRLALLEVAAQKEDAAREAAIQREVRRTAVLEAAAHAEDARRAAAARGNVPQAPANADPFAGFGSGGAGAGITGIPPVVARASVEVDKLNPKLRQTANAMAIVSQAATTGSGSMAGLAVAVGNVAQGMSALTTSAKALQTATIIGLIVTVGATIGGIFKSNSDRAKELERSIADANAEIAGMGQAMNNNDLASKITAINRAIDQQIERLETDKSLLEEMGVHESERAALVEALNKKRATSIALAEREARIKLDDFEHAQANEVRLTGLQNARGKSEAELAEFRIATESGERQTAIARLFAEKGLTDEQIKRRQLLLDGEKALTDALLERNRIEANAAVAQLEIQRLGMSDDPRDVESSRLKQIEIEREADIKATGDVENANRVAELKIRALRRQTFLEGTLAYERLSIAAKRHGTFAVAAAASIADAVRRFEILVQAKKDAILAKSEFAAALKSLGSRDFWGATQHFASSAGYAAAAAAGGAEALGSGGGGGGGGGGGAGGGGSFEPRNSTEGGGDIVLIIQQIDASNGEITAVTRSQIDRAQVLNRPLRVTLPPQRVLPSLSYGF